MASEVLEPLAQGVYAGIQAQPGLGRANAGVIVDHDGITVVDTLMVPSQSGPFAAAVGALGHRVRRIVLTASQIEFVGGTLSFPMAAVYGTPETSALLDQPSRPDVYRRLAPACAEEFDDEMVTRPVTHIVAEAAELTPAAALVPLGGQSAENLVVLLPESDIAFGGALCSFGVTPLAFAGDPLVWAETLDAVAELAGTIVPGHGPVGGQAEVREQQAYLRACVAAGGDPSGIPPGPWDAWPGREWDPVNVERAAMLARGDASIPPSMLRAVGLG
ncbi:hypothetical protein BH24ACT3_BH24ACT3_12010 [soil metagenome]